MDEVEDKSTPQEEKENINFAPKKKRIHSDVTAVIIGDTKKALFSPKKSKKQSNKDNLSNSTINRNSDGELIEEENTHKKMSSESMIAKLQIASLIFDNLPSFSSAQLQKTKKPRKMIQLNTKITKQSYLDIFGCIGVQQDLSRCVTPPDDPFDLYCNLIRASGVRGTASSKASLLAKWNALSEEEKNNYDEKLTEIKRAYNQQFNEENKQKSEGKLPLYEERKITDLQGLEKILGPLSLQRKYVGFRTIAGQIAVLVAVNAPVSLIYDECDQSLQIHFSVSPIILDNEIS